MPVKPAKKKIGTVFVCLFVCVCIMLLKPHSLPQRRAGNQRLRLYIGQVGAQTLQALLLLTPM